jgi:outer membrane lipoprotein-sorting protein
MIRFLFSLCILSIPVIALSQENQITQDPAAEEILDRVAAKTSQMKSLKADFELVIEDRKEKTKNTSEGSLLLKQNKYKINSQGNTVYYDGTTMWTYVSDNNEVTITEPDVREEDIFTSPYLIFSNYKNNFKYRYVRNATISGTRYHEIDLFPKNLNQPYSRIKVFVSVKNELPEIISSIGKDGIDYTVSLKNYAIGVEVNDATFVFDPSKFKKVEVVDMRGLK